ncbi:MAG: FAD:protein FMN transferase [Romboutsia sp.]|uniref:FAD:protein FMN transferase n=1 Tax=Romboutsia sp. TaxID=1965302 RepID=UPI003F40078F
MIKKTLVSILTIFLTLAISGCSNEGENDQLSRTEIFMGTPIKLTLYNESNEEILDKAFEKVSKIEDTLSINKPGTELDNLNAKSGISPVVLSEMSYDIIRKALEYSKLSDGGYDVSIGPLIKLWSIGLPEAKVPTQEEINEVIKLIDYSNIDMNDSNREVFLSKKGMIVDLGSIAKGYVADELVKLLKDEGIEKAIIDLGGNIYALGYKEENKKWRIGIQNPFDDRGNVVGTIDVANKSVVTTGVYERFIEKNGKKYHHILNPKTGYPYETNIAGVSIVADHSIDADALSTLVFTKGLEEGLKFVNELENVDAIFITNKKEIYTTKGIKDNFKIMNEEFKLCN